LLYCALEKKKRYGKNTRQEKNKIFLKYFWKVD
jgi:hypothetical protein